MHENTPLNSNENTSPDAIGEQNTARLLAQAYRPELPDPMLAQRVKEAMLAAGTPRSLPWPMRNARALLVAVAAIVVAVIGLILLVSQPREPGYHRDGSTVWINGKPYVPAQDKPQPAPGSGGPVADGAAAGGLTARPPTTRPALDVAQAGQTITTEAGQRRRVGLADGSVLYINQNTALRIDGPRRVTLNSGEAYFEVSPRQGVASVKDPTFFVKTPGRQVAALGTHFNVCVRATGTNVLVTQGKVDVDGTDVYAGEELPPENEPGAGGAAATPRTTLVLDWIRDLVTAAQTPLVPSSAYEGGALIAIDPWGQESRLALRNYTVDVYIEDGFARTTIDQTYFNYENSRLEGTFYFPLPADASLSRLAMYVDGTLMEGGMCERDEARQVYENIVNQRRDPALLEWVDGTTFKMRVFPLEARQEKRIILSYTQKLANLYGQAQYRFPAGHTMNLVRDWSFRATIKNGSAGNWASSSHMLTPAAQDQDLVLTTSGHQVKPDRDVTLTLGNLSMSQSNDRTRFSVADYEGQRYLMVRSQPPLMGEARHQRRDWVFLFESSGSRDPLLARAQVEIVRTLLENAEHDDTFAIVTAGTHASVMGPALPATPENVQLAVAYLEQTHLIGALDLGEALDAAAPLVGHAANPYLVHLGSGNSILGQRSSDELVKRIPAGAKYVGIGVGKNWSRQFMKAAAGSTGGFFTQINPDEPIAWRTIDLLATLNTPRLLDVKVTDPAGNVSFLSFDDALAQGEELCAIARFPMTSPAPAEVVLTGTLDGRPFHQTLRVGAVAANAGYLPRMWTKLEIDRLLAEGSEANKPAIIALSKAMYVMSPYTSLLVLENEAMYEQFKVDRGRKDHWAMYPAPEKIGVVYEPDPLRPSAQPLVAGQRLPADQALASILVRIAPQPLYWPNEQRRYWGATATARDFFLGLDQSAGDWLDSDFLPRSRFQIFQKGFNSSEVGDLRMSRWAQQNGQGQQPSQMLYSLKLQDQADKVEQQMKGMYDAYRAPASRHSVLTISNKFDSLDFDSRYLSPVGQSLGDRRYLALGSQIAALEKQRQVFLKSMDRENRRFSRDDVSDFEDFAYSINNGYRSLVYQRPSYSNDWRVFADLLQYAPGMNTSDADIQAVLESEAVADPAAAPGTVAPEARALIERARTAGWLTATVSQGPRLPAFPITFDGQGRYRYERIVSEGLRETVICDGTTLLHLYPDLGIGARRTVSRFHRETLGALIPWALPTADDLARGCNLTLTADGAVAVTPLGADQRKDAQGKPQAYASLQLVFAGDGRLAERRWIEMPTGKTLYRETYSAAGIVRGQDDQEKETAQLDLALTPAAQPLLTADTKELVVVPMPIRDRAYLLRGENLANASRYDWSAKWSEELALAVVAADLSGNPAEAMTIVGARFFAQGDRRIGFYTLLLAAQYNFTPDTALNISNNVRITFNPLTDHPLSPLARYFVDQQKVNQQGYNAADISTGGTDGFVPRLAAIRAALIRIQKGSNTTAERTAAQTSALDVARTCNDPYFAWALFTVSLNYGGGDGPNYYRTLADTAKSVQNVPGLYYAARIEEARALYQSGTEANRALAKTKYLALYNETLAGGSLPLIDYEFRNAVQGDNGADWSKLMRDASALLKSKYGRAAGVYHAWQLNQLGDQALSEELLASALTDVPLAERAQTILVATSFLQSVNQYPRAASMLQPLLEDPKWNQSPTLWSLAAQLAYNRGMLAQGLSYQERAMDLEFAGLPPIINLQVLREEYSQAMAQYLRLASAMSTLKQAPSADLIARVIRTADRWRALDPDKTAACQSAARVFLALNVRELAWDYMTTPLAEKSNEGQPWVNLAQLLRQEGDFTLADRAYVTAFDVEPTNAQSLWDRAMLLQQTDRLAEARKLFQQLADGKWEQRFSGIQTQARNYVQSH